MSPFASQPIVQWQQLLQILPQQMLQLQQTIQALPQYVVQLVVQTRRAPTRCSPRLQELDRCDSLIVALS